MRTDNLYTISQYAKLMGISRPTVYKYIRQGRIKTRTIAGREFIKVKETIAEIIQAIHRMGVTVLLVEQNVEMALGISHRAYVIDEGRIQMSGEAKAILADEQVACQYLAI